ncbi:MAG: pilin, partial [Patescibacteria group bacterium]|nr:pilin [Patescibacteria group bacterium]
TTKLTNPLGTTSIPEIIGRIIKAALGIVGSIALLMFVYGGFTLLTSSGNEKSVQKGKDILTWATIGLVVIFVSYIAVNFVLGALTESGEDEEILKETSEGVCCCDGRIDISMNREECSRIEMEAIGCSWNSSGFCD